MNDIILVKIRHSLKDLLGVSSEHSFIQGSKPGEDAGNRAPGHKLHKDADYALLLLQTGAKISVTTTNQDICNNNEPRYHLQTIVTSVFLKPGQISD